MIQKIKLHNFQLFKETEFTLDQINLITGVNLDDIEQSSNGSGKSSLAKNAITFALYGDVPGINLKDLIHIGQNECSVELECSLNNEQFRIIRKIPSSLQIFCDNKEIQANTQTIKQNIINEHFGNYDLFKKFRMIDTKGINLLDLGIISLRSELMKFIDDLFNTIRKSLLSKKLERETYNVDKRLYKFYLSEKRLQILKAGLDSLAYNSSLAHNNADEQYKIMGKIESEIQSREKLIYFKNKDIEKLHGGICPILGNKCPTISGHLEKVDIIKKQEINQLVHEIETFRSQLENEKEAYSFFANNHSFLENKRNLTRQYLMKLQEAFKFKDYKYTLKDVELYTEAIKILDNFAGYYINDWLSELSVIINDLLKNVDLSVTITEDKDFMKIKNGNNEIKFEMLSGGQKCFLSSIFKIAILLHKGESSGIILADEGLEKMDFINFKKFIEICKTLPFQYFVVYHGLKSKIEDINYINTVRENGVSTIK
jgi:hypothetical protein